jgi:hypothetical protein
MIRSVTCVILFYATLCAAPGTIPGEEMPEPEGAHYPGVIARVYNEPDFKRIKRCLEPQDSLVTFFDDGHGHGIDWSGIWEGYLIAPVTGQLALHLRAWKPTTLDLYSRGRVVTDGPTGVAVDGSVSFAVEKGEAVPFRISYVHAKGGRGGWEVRWSTPDQVPSTIPGTALFIDDRLAEYYNWRPEPDLDSIDFSQFATAEKEDVIVYYEPGRATGWPANQGFFAWGDEILMTFDKGYHLDRGLNHSIDPTRPGENRQLRSRDGGLSWTEEPFEPIAPADANAHRLPPDLDFQNPGFAIRTYGANFVYTLDRGQSWRGPFKWPDMGYGAYTSRTDAHSLRPGFGLLGFSVEAYENPPKHADHTYFVELDQTHRTLRFLGWLTPPTEPKRAVMPDTVRIGPLHLITAARRKSVEHFDDRPPLSRNWIEAFESKDNAKTWRSLGEIAETDRGRFNGNPPSLVYLGGNRLAAIYGFRGVPYSIRARISQDLGRNWGREILLRDDVVDFDSGYVQSARRTDGKIVSIYYLKTRERIELHFEATIWDPDSIR